MAGVQPADVQEENDGFTALHIAVKLNELSKAERLISLGADVNAKNSYLDTPLHIAGDHNEIDSHFKMAEMLLKKGADLTAMNEEGQTPFYVMAEDANLKMVQLFLDYKVDVNCEMVDKKNVLFAAAEYNTDVEVMQLLIDLGLDVNHHNVLGQTPLHMASYWMSRNVVKCLLRNGADVNILDHQGFTYLMRLLESGDNHGEKEIMKYYLSFVLDYIDFNVIRNDVNFLTLPDLPDYLWKIVLAHLAKLQSLNNVVHPTLANIISKDKAYN